MNPLLYHERFITWHDGVSLHLNVKYPCSASGNHLTSSVSDVEVWMQMGGSPSTYCCQYILYIYQLLNTFPSVIDLKWEQWSRKGSVHVFMILLLTCVFLFLSVWLHVCSPSLVCVGRVFLQLSERVKAVTCPDKTSECPNRTTCCQLPDRSWGCCPLAKVTHLRNTSPHVQQNNSNLSSQTAKHFRSGRKSFFSHDTRKQASFRSVSSEY